MSSGFNIRRSGIEHNRTLGYEICKRWSIKKGGDVKPLLQLFHDDATITTMVDPDLLPESATPRTKKQFGQFVNFATRDQGLTLELRGITAQEERFALEFVSNAVVNGHIYKNNCHGLFEVRDDKISAARMYGDTLLASKWQEWIKEGKEANGEN